ncbi:MAG TPA: PIG-L family deacetylase [Gaiellaceae bacterium]|jgi:LmbE family N-acetylglucosaminyl deacetylase|nr:PIG-L family deacetylase [Gaiellaceae bacterium]
MTVPRHTLLVVAPHPDDETIALGGTIHDHLGRGGSCEIVAVTDGEAADDEAGLDERVTLAQTRIAERAAALERIGAAGVTVERLEYPDRQVAEHVAKLERDLRGAFAALRRREPDCLVALPWRDDPHPDHRACARAGIEAAIRAGVSYVEVPIWGWYDSRFRRRLSPSRVHRLPISRVGRGQKRAALQCFRSQLQPLSGGRGPVLPSDFVGAFDQGFEVLVR